MAEERGPVGSKRSFLFIFLAGFFTLGIYWAYWYYKTNEEIKEYAKLNISPAGCFCCCSAGSCLSSPAFMPITYGCAT